MAFTAGPSVARGLVLRKHRNATPKRGDDGTWRVFADVTRERVLGSGPTEGAAWEDAADGAIRATVGSTVGGPGSA